MSVNDQYALNWSNHTNHIRKAFDSLLAGSEFVDVTLSCEGKKISAHKMLLSACSTYFHDLFRDNPCQHPIVILKDVKFQNVMDILKFMYNGEVSVATENFDSFLKTAELLQVSGLTDDENRYGTSDKEDEGAESTQLSFITENPERANIRPVLNKSIADTPKEKEVAKKRAVESGSVEEGTSQISKKRKDSELKADVDIKQEEADVINLEDDNLDVRDPLELDQQNEALEGMDLLQPAGSQKFADVQDLLNAHPGYFAPDVNPENKCPLCDKVFSHRYSLKLHLPSHTGNTQCNICGLILCRIYELKKHMKKKHNIM